MSTDEQREDQRHLTTHPKVQSWEDATLIELRSTQSQWEEAGESVPQTVGHSSPFADLLTALELGDPLLGPGEQFAPVYLCPVSELRNLAGPSRNLRALMPPLRITEGKRKAQVVKRKAHPSPIKEPCAAISLSADSCKEREEFHCFWFPLIDIQEKFELPTQITEFIHTAHEIRDEEAALCMQIGAACIPEYNDGEKNLVMGHNRKL
ncbi:hypothetical protein MJG53_002257 [Ovis ammon polii x Ovis aries]|uniref:Uncharacterized protein n=1 Tax=Ovis ammon polii x Ovis aries TaxID=2918886 RepID=A0ACB9VN83_9CETA|nr:hypothetical protein MJG53_002257 [Ovis ammon polii x Ovis aries]